MRCRLLQCVAVYCSALQCAAVCCSELQRVAACCSAIFCNVIQYRVMYVAVERAVLPSVVSVSCRVLPCLAVSCRVLQCVLQSVTLRCAVCIAFCYTMLCSVVQCGAV